VATGGVDGHVVISSIAPDSLDQEPKVLQTIRDHSKKVGAVDLHPTRPFLLSGSADKTVKLWRAENENHDFELALRCFFAFFVKLKKRHIFFACQRRHVRAVSSTRQFFRVCRP
jgi:WD40 repeat protein